MSGDVEEVHSEDSACDSDDGWKHVAWRPQGNSRLPLDAGLSDGPHVDSQLFGPRTSTTSFQIFQLGTQRRMEVPQRMLHLCRAPQITFLVAVHG